MDQQTLLPNSSFLHHCHIVLHCCYPKVRFQHVPLCSRPFPTPRIDRLQLWKVPYGRTTINCRPRGQEIDIVCIQIHMDVSKNSGTPKSSIFTGFSIINIYKPSILGYHHFWKHPYLYKFYDDLHCPIQESTKMDSTHRVFRYSTVGHAVVKESDTKVPVAKPLVKVRSFAGCFIVHPVTGKLDQTFDFCVLFADGFADHAMASLIPFC